MKYFCKIFSVIIFILLFNTHFSYSSGVWNANNNLILLSKKRQQFKYCLYIITQELKIINKIENVGYPFKWSPDGSMIFCSTIPRGTFSIIRIDDINNPLEFRIKNVYGIRDATWSPNQRWIALHTGGRVYVVEVSTLTSEKVDKKPGSLHSPIWSPDSKKLAFGTTTLGETPNAESRIYVYYPESKKVISVGTSIWQFRGHWSPDSDRIIFQGLSSINLFEIFNQTLKILKLEHKGKDLLFPKWIDRDIIEYVAPSQKQGNHYWSIYEFDTKQEVTKETVQLTLTQYTGHPFPFIEPKWNPQHDALVYPKPKGLIFKDIKNGTVIDFGEKKTFRGWSPDGNKFIYSKPDYQRMKSEYYLLDRQDPENPIKLKVD